MKGSTTTVVPRTKSKVLAFLTCIISFCLLAAFGSIQSVKKPLFSIAASTSSTSSNTHSFKLFRHNITRCVSRYQEHIPPFLDEDVAMRSRLECLCIDESNPSRRNCLLRSRDVTVQKLSVSHTNNNKKHHKSKTTKRKKASVHRSGHRSVEFYTVISILSPEEFYIRIDTEDESPAAHPSPIYLSGVLQMPRQQPRGVYKVPTQLHNNAADQSYFYHSIAGPQGAFQYVQTREAINQFYESQAADDRDGERPQRSILPLSTTLPEDYAEHPPIHGPCSGSEFWRSAGVAQRTYLSPMVLLAEYREHKDRPRDPKADVFSYFGNRLGFCQKLLKANDFIAASDLWINLLYGQIGSVWSNQRVSIPLESLPPHYLTLAEYGTQCPAKAEEQALAKWALNELKRVMSIGLNATSSMGIRCLNVTRNVAGKLNETMCVLVTARPILVTTLRTRGIPPGLEHSILNALLAPNDLYKPKETPRIRWTNNTAKEEAPQCKFFATSNAKKSISFNVSDVESLNYEAGLPPCETATRHNPFNFRNLRFKSSSPFYNTSHLLRLRLEDYTLTEQLKQIQSANLFIVEEGAAATWAFFANHGSTVIILTTPNYMPWMRMYAPVEATDGRVMRKYPAPYAPKTDYFVFPPSYTGNVRIIFLINQQGRLPSFAMLREAYDRPWKAEVLFVGCECTESRFVDWDSIAPKNCADQLTTIFQDDNSDAKDDVTVAVDSADN